MEVESKKDILFLPKALERLSVALEALDTVSSSDKAHQSFQTQRSQVQGGDDELENKEREGGSHDHQNSLLLLTVEDTCRIVRDALFSHRVLISRRRRTVAHWGLSSEHKTDDNGSTCFVRSVLLRREAARSLRTRLRLDSSIVDIVQDLLDNGTVFRIDNIEDVVDGVNGNGGCDFDGDRDRVRNEMGGTQAAAGIVDTLRMYALELRCWSDSIMNGDDNNSADKDDDDRIDLNNVTVSDGVGGNDDLPDTGIIISDKTKVNAKEKVVVETEGEIEAELFRQRIISCPNVLDTVRTFLDEVGENSKWKASTSNSFSNQRFDTATTATTITKTDLLDTTVYRNPRDLSLVESMDKEILQTESKCNNRFCRKPSAIFVLLVGGPSTGKTHICDDIQRIVRMTKHRHRTEKTIVVRPSLPIDFLGPRVGSFEDRIISLFNYASSRTEPCIVLLDDIEHIVGNESATSGSKNSTDGSIIDDFSPKGTHLLSRSRSIFLSAIDLLRSSSLQLRSDLLVICTSQTEVYSCYSDRFDCVHHLNETGPDAHKRREILISFLLLTGRSCRGEMDNVIETCECSDAPLASVEDLIIDVVQCTVGRSIGEISNVCRRAIVGVSKSFTCRAMDSDCDRDRDNDVDTTLSLSHWMRAVLLHIKRLIQTVNPASLGAGESSNVSGITVLTSRDLARWGVVAKLGEGRRSKDNIMDLQPENCAHREGNINSLAERAEPLLPLLGAGACQAWEVLKKTIIVPLCHSDIMDELLGKKNDPLHSSAFVRCGVLLAGGPGTGKTTLAYHCANVAASYNPSIRLIEVPCTSLITKEVGGSERAVRDIFSRARRASPCILLLEGVENLAPPRGGDNTTEGTMDRLLSTLLIEIDGIASSSSTIMSSPQGIAVIGITHDEQRIDPALRRPGRLQRCIILPSPGLQERIEIISREIEGFDINFVSSTPTSFTNDDDENNIPLVKNKEQLSQIIAVQTSGMTAAEVVAVCNNVRMMKIRQVINEKSVDSDSDHPIFSDHIKIPLDYFFESLKNHVKI